MKTVKVEFTADALSTVVYALKALARDEVIQVLGVPITESLAASDEWKLAEMLEKLGKDQL